jgi:hypothetical protein
MDRNTSYFLPISKAAAFRYDIDTQTLSVIGGTFTSPNYREYKVVDSVPVAISEGFNNNGTYEATNEFGAKAVVTREYFHDYFLHIKNLSPFESFKRKSEGPETESFVLNVSLPRDEAKAVADDLRVVCEIRISGRDECASECVLTSEPTVSRPRDQAFFSHGMGAEIVSLRVVNIKTMEQFAIIKVP